MDISGITPRVPSHSLGTLNSLALQKWPQCPWLVDSSWPLAKDYIRPQVKQMLCAPQDKICPPQVWQRPPLPATKQITRNKCHCNLIGEVLALPQRVFTYGASGPVWE